VNEIQLLRAQLDGERRRVREVAAACAATHGDGAAQNAAGTPAALTRACTAYLACVLGWFEARDARLGRGGVLRGAPVSIGDQGSAREALALLDAANAKAATWRALALFVQGAWDERRGAIETLLAANGSVADWRIYAGVDADSISLERTLYRQVRAALPAGIELP
jgi:hypothetical protein